MALSAPSDISVLNVLQGTVIDIVPGRDARALVRVQVGATVLSSRITRFSAQRLELAPGGRVYVMIKAVSLA